MTGAAWPLVRGTTGLYGSPCGRWQVYSRDGLWILRDLSMARSPREHWRDVERAFHTLRELAAHVDGARP